MRTTKNTEPSTHNGRAEHTEEDKAMMKINETRNLENGQTISIRKEDNAYTVWVDEKIAYTASLLECRAYAEARVCGNTHTLATEAAKIALEKKNSRPTEAQKAHELGMTIREYRAHRAGLRQASTASTNHTTATEAVNAEVREAIETARNAGLDLDMNRVGINLKVDFTTGEVIRLEDKTEAEKEAELKLWAKLWSQELVAIKAA